jgi:uncharacterized protein
MKKAQLLIIFLLPILFLTSCSTATRCRNEYTSAYRQGNFSQSEIRLTQQISKEMPTEQFQESPEAVWLLLDRATTRFAMGNMEGAISDYKQAIEAIDYYCQELSSESLGKLLMQDELGAYIAEDFEQVLARLYFALALLHEGDEGNAYALLRQAEMLQQEKREQYASSELTCNYQLVDNAACKYLLALLLERRNDLSNASLLYRQAKSLSCQTLEAQENRGATVLLICHNGNVPEKISVITNASVASLVALEIFLDGTEIAPPAACELGGIPVPALRDPLFSQPIPTFASLDGQQQLLAPWYDVSRVAKQQLDQKMPVIAARSLARYLIRRAAVGYAKEQDPDLGAVIDLGMLMANLTTKADTRSWTTLPAAIDLGRYEVPQGDHRLIIQTSAGQSFTSTLALNSGDLCVINIFNIQPGVTQIQIPQRFLKNKEFDP